MDDLANQFNSVKELKQYCNSQFVVIQELQRKIAVLEQQKTELEETVEKQAQKIFFGGENEINEFKGVSDEMVACLTQIRLLRERAHTRELNYEEAKKLDIYTKLLLSIKAQEKAKPNPADGLTDEELINSLVEVNSNATK